MRLIQSALRLLILVLIVYGSVTLWSVSQSLTQAREMLAVQRKTVSNLQMENAKLALRVKETDEEEKWEHIAREQLGLVDPEEIVIYNVGD